MINLNISQKRNIIHILTLIMKADRVIADEEVQYLNEVFNLFDLDIVELDHTELVNLDSLVKEFSSYNEEVKEYGKKLFKGMASCDGFVDPSEVAIIDRFG
ncbi:MAG: hypothetical protein J6I79_00310 [Paludibacteraceae bacterium]|nr:hypothetical protein [Paludibacteraceae bacterium]